jgi:quinol monooxygenase YgiN
MKNHVYVVAKILAKPSHEKELRVALLGLVDLARTEPGFIQYDLHVSNENAAEFVFYEIWESEELLDLHNNSDEMKAFGAKAGGWIESVEIKKYQKIS